MHHAFLDEFRDIQSPIHRLPVKIKLVFLIFYILAVVLTPIHLFRWFILYTAFILAVILLSRLPWGFIFKRLREISPFILLVLVSYPFLYKEQRILILSRCLIRAILAGLAMVVVLSTVRFTRLLEGLRGLGCPIIFIRLLSFMYRYLFVLEDEFERMQRSFRSRSAGEAKKWLQVKSFGNLLGVLFIRAFERAERIYSAMCARGLNEQDH